MSERDTFEDWAQSNDDPEPDDSGALEAWLGEIAAAIAAFGAGES